MCIRDRRYISAGSSKAGAILTIRSIPPEKVARMTDITIPINALNISPSCLEMCIRDRYLPSSCLSKQELPHLFWVFWWYTGSVVNMFQKNTTVFCRSDITLSVTDWCRRCRMQCMMTAGFCIFIFDRRVIFQVSLFDLIKSRCHNKRFDYARRVPELSASQKIHLLSQTMPA